LKINPKDVDALDAKGMALIELGKYNEAIVIFDKALKIDPNYVPVLYDKAFSLAQLGKYNEAISYYDKVLKIDPSNNNAIYQKELLLYELNTPEEQQLPDYGPPKTTIDAQKVTWEFSDLKGNRYHWEMPVSTYEYYVNTDRQFEYLILEIPDKGTVSVVDFTKFVGQSFAEVIDEIYLNSKSDEDFIFEVWYIVSQMTIYSYDIGEYPRYALETFSGGTGDCEDTSILIADMLRSSKYTQDWQIQLVYLDADSPTYPRTMNHVIVAVNTGEFYTIIESTAKTIDGAKEWNDDGVSGWFYDV